MSKKTREDSLSARITKLTNEEDFPHWDQEIKPFLNKENSYIHLLFDLKPPVILTLNLRKKATDTRIAQFSGIDEDHVRDIPQAFFDEVGRKEVKVHSLFDSDTPQYFYDYLYRTDYLITQGTNMYFIFVPSEDKDRKHDAIKLLGRVHETQSIAESTILKYTDKSLHKLIASAKGVRQMYELLKNKFLVSSSVRQTSLEKQMHDLKFTDLLSYTESFSLLYNEYSEFENAQERLVRNSFVKDIPRNSTILSKVLEYDPDESTLLEMLKGLSIYAKTQRKYGVLETTGTSSNQHRRVNLVQDNNVPANHEARNVFQDVPEHVAKRLKAKDNTYHPRCGVCGGHNHIAIMCPSPAKGCYRCGDYDHVITDCPKLSQRNQRKRKRVRMITEILDKDSDDEYPSDLETLERSITRRVEDVSVPNAADGLSEV